MGRRQADVWLIANPIVRTARGWLSDAIVRSGLSGSMIVSVRDEAARPGVVSVPVTLLARAVPLPR